MRVEFWEGIKRHGSSVACTERRPTSPPVVTRPASNLPRPPNPHPTPAHHFHHSSNITPPPQTHQTAHTPIPQPTCSSDTLLPMTAVSPMTTPVPWSSRMPRPKRAAGWMSTANTFETGSSSSGSRGEGSPKKAEQRAQERRWRNVTLPVDFHPLRKQTVQATLSPHTQHSSR